MAMVMIGVDPHKASHTAVAINAAEQPLGRRPSPYHACWFCLTPSRWVGLAQVGEISVSERVALRLPLAEAVVAGFVTVKTSHGLRSVGGCGARNYPSFGIYEDRDEYGGQVQYGGEPAARPPLGVSPGPPCQGGPHAGHA
jgi:hypothetical protein